MLVATSAVATEDAFAGKKKYKSQASSQANACGNGKLPINVGCQNVDSQIQGDENAVTQTAQQRHSQKLNKITGATTATDSAREFGRDRYYNPTFLLFCSHFVKDFFYSANIRFLFSIVFS
jgi:hypothetical protein